MDRIAPSPYPDAPCPSGNISDSGDLPVVKLRDCRRMPARKRVNRRVYPRWGATTCQTCEAYEFSARENQWDLCFHGIVDASHWSVGECCGRTAQTPRRDACTSAEVVEAYARQ